MLALRRLRLVDRWHWLENSNWKLWHGRRPTDIEHESNGGKRWPYSAHRKKRSLHQNSFASQDAGSKQLPGLRNRTEFEQWFRVELRMGCQCNPKFGLRSVKLLVQYLVLVTIYVKVDLIQNKSQLFLIIHMHKYLQLRTTWPNVKAGMRAINRISLNILFCVELQSNINRAAATLFYTRVIWPRFVCRIQYIYLSKTIWTSVSSYRPFKMYTKISGYLITRYKD